MEAYCYGNIPCPPISVRLTGGRILEIGVSILVLAIIKKILAPVKRILAVGVLILVIALVLPQSVLPCFIDRVPVEGDVV